MYLLYPNVPQYVLTVVLGVRFVQTFKYKNGHTTYLLLLFCFSNEIMCFTVSGPYTIVTINKQWRRMVDFINSIEYNPT